MAEARIQDDECYMVRAPTKRGGQVTRKNRVGISRGLAIVLSIAGSVVSSGCLGQLGPSAVDLTRTHYNQAAQRTSAEELLLNLVRLRYRDTPYFLQIATLSTSMKARAGLDAGGSFPDDSPDVGSITGTLVFEESPTITYTPLVGDRFVTQLLQPVEPEILVLLSHAGWSMDRFLRLFVQEIGGIPNAPTASGPTPSRAPEFEDFRRVSSLLRTLQSRRQVALVRGTLRGRRAETPAPGSAGVLLRFTPAAFETDEYEELRGRLGLERGREIFQLVTGVGARSPERINVVLRSVLSAMFYASHGIEVPPEHRQEGRVTTTRTAEGEPFEWSRLTGALLEVRSGRPETTPYTLVEYRGHRFYIDDDDLESKSTFSMLNLVLALQAGELPSGGPILTLPVVQ